MFFKFTTAGESHGKALVSIVEGLPSGLRIEVGKINYELWRRQQGYGRGGRMKIEQDKIEILSGVRYGSTIGSPVSFTIKNKDFVHWEKIMSVEKPDSLPKNMRILKRPRPGHADLPGGQKFQTRDLRNVLERASARETASRVACGAFAKQLLEAFNIKISSHVVKLGNVPEKILRKNWEDVKKIPDDSPMRCADGEIQNQMMALVDRAKENGDTLGGVFEVIAKNLPVGLGTHTSWSEKLDGRIAQAIMSIQAIKAVEIGEAIENVGLFGSDAHDEITYVENSYKRTRNRAGGLEGGITNGEEIRVRGYKKPISTLRKPLKSVDIDSKKEDLAAFERSDITAVPAAGVIGEAMLAIVLANSMREKFGGDSFEEMKSNFQNYQDSLKSY